MPKYCPGFGAPGAEIGKKTPGLFGQADMEPIQIGGNAGMMSNINWGSKDLRNLQEAGAEIRTNETEQKKDQFLKTDLDTRMTEKFNSRKKVHTYSNCC